MYYTESSGNRIIFSLVYMAHNTVKDKYKSQCQWCIFAIYIYVRVYATACKTSARVSISSHVKRERGCKSLQELTTQYS